MPKSCQFGLCEIFTAVNQVFKADLHHRRDAPYRLATKDALMSRIKSPFRKAIFLAMKTPVNVLKHNLLFINYTRQNHHLNFHTNTHLIQLLQTSKTTNPITSIHTSLLKSGYLHDTYTTNHLLNAYIRIPSIENAHQLFDEMPEPNVVSWTALIAGYNNNERPEVALQLFKKMSKGHVLPNSFTFATVIKACSALADIDTGRKIHAQIETSGLEPNLVVCTALIDMYGKCSNVDEAHKIFDTMEDKNVVTWTSMIVAYAQNALGEDALGLLREFSKTTSMSPNHFMLASVINACASLGRLVAGKVTHGVVTRRCYNENEVVASALVDMYAKCGCLAYSDKVFRMMKTPCVISYTSMIIGTAKYGTGDVSLGLFDDMLKRGIRPNDVTFVGVLHACSHSGFVDIGLEHLNTMYVKHGVMPDAKHYMCVVDMLARVGRLDEAYRLAKTVQTNSEDAALMWGSLLSASRTYGKSDLTIEAGERLIKSNQQLASAYVTMSNTYASEGKWENVYQLRSEMKRQGVYKEPGCSWMEIKDATYVFYAGDASSCTRGEEILNLLTELGKRMRERGYVGDGNGLVFVDVEEEAKQAIVGLHSEKLALAFGLISIPKGITIRVMKNLRMCWDCHEAFKLISDIVERDFVVRDVNRFHHFRDGSCTCKDFW